MKKIKKRVAAIEKEINELQKQVAAYQLTNWLQKFTGSFKDDPAFEDVLAYGQAIRAGDKSMLESDEE